MLNRLMFVYFIQKKGFLDGDRDYLRNRLKRVRRDAGAATSSTRSTATSCCGSSTRGWASRRARARSDTGRLLGSVPYLNGGLFEVHELEQDVRTAIHIPDEAFERSSTSSTTTTGTSTSARCGSDNEINPDVLGYIFEKYINQKQMGAYYTKEDITEYISQEHDHPLPVRRRAEGMRRSPSSPTAPLAAAAGRPRPLHLRRRQTGCHRRRGRRNPLPAEIAAGWRSSQARRLEPAAPPSVRAADRDLARARRPPRRATRRSASKLASGEVHDDQRPDHAQPRHPPVRPGRHRRREGPELLRAFWQAVEQDDRPRPDLRLGRVPVRRADILEPLYDACLERMEGSSTTDRAREPHHPEKFSDFRKILAQIDTHPNRRYFILKSIIINNLYGVDIMEEAVEICKLRLFLKLVAQVEPARRRSSRCPTSTSTSAPATRSSASTTQDVRRAAL